MKQEDSLEGGYSIRVSLVPLSFNACDLCVCIYIEIKHVEVLSLTPYAAFGIKRQTTTDDAIS
jgi:hypothetical protein